MTKTYPNVVQCGPGGQHAVCVQCGASLHGDLVIYCTQLQEDFCSLACLEAHSKSCVECSGSLSASKENATLGCVRCQERGSKLKKMTLCTFEDPKARPDIERWLEENSQQGRLKRLEAKEHGRIFVELPGETMWIIPISGPNSVGQHLEFINGCRWNKWIHFGKLEFTPEQYRRIIIACVQPGKLPYTWADEEREANCDDCGQEHDDGTTCEEAIQDGE